MRTILLLLVRCLPYPRSNTLTNSNRAIIASLFLIVSCFWVPTSSEAEYGPITIDDLVQRVQIPVVSVSPDGNQVAYLTVQGLAKENLYEAALYITATNGETPPTLIDHYRVTPEATFDADSGVIRQSAGGQVAWKPDSQALIFTARNPSGMTLKVRELLGGTETVLLENFNEIDIVPIVSSLAPVKVKTFSLVDGTAHPEYVPADLGLLVKDSFRFYAPFRNPKVSGRTAVKEWAFDWNNLESTGESSSYRENLDEWTMKQVVAPGSPPDAVNYVIEEKQSPDGQLVAQIEDSYTNLGYPEAARRNSRIVLKRIANPIGNVSEVNFEEPIAFVNLLGWEPNSKTVYYLVVGSQRSTVNTLSIQGERKEIYRDDGALGLPTPDLELSSDHRVLVAVRSTNITPDELVALDLRNGRAKVLAVPNQQFSAKAAKAAAVIRFVPIACCGGQFYGRLYLPASTPGQHGYPLVFTNYISTPGFYASVGDELPILPLVENGIAVFSLHSKDANITSSRGDFRLEIERVARPLAAMEWAYHKLSGEGIVDPDRCGLTGVSYGAEIAMYSYWKAKVFRAVSVATSSWEPINVPIGGITYASFLESRGLLALTPDTYNQWKQLAVSLNLENGLPPLLMQSSDKEEYFGNIETWFSLRRANLPVEWVVYPDEGHIKRSPTNKWWVYQRNLDWFLFWLKGEERSNDPLQYQRWQAMRSKSTRVPLQNALP